MGGGSGAAPLGCAKSRRGTFGSPHAPKFERLPAETPCLTGLRDPLPSRSLPRASGPAGRARRDRPRQHEGNAQRLCLDSGDKHAGGHDRRECERDRADAEVRPCDHLERLVGPHDCGGPGVVAGPVQQLAVALALIAATSCGHATQPPAGTTTPATTATATPTAPRSEVPEGGVAVYVEDARFAAMVADTQAERTQGLSGHPGLADENGEVAEVEPAVNALPKVGLGIDYLSGDETPSDDEYTAFNTLYATNHKYYGYIDYFLDPAARTLDRGLVDGIASLTLGLPRDLRMDVDAHAFWTQQEIAPDAARLIGYEMDVTLPVRLGEGQQLQLGYSLFRNGAAAPLVGLGQDGGWSHWAYIQATFSFGGSLTPIL